MSKQLSAIDLEVSALLERVSQDRDFAASLPLSLEDYVSKLIERAELTSWYVGGKLCGLVAFYANDPERREAFISMVAVAPEARRLGIARALLVAVLNNLSSRGFVKCGLEVRAYNQVAIKLYKDLGFELDYMLKDVAKMQIRLPLVAARPL